MTTLCSTFLRAGLAAAITLAPAMASAQASVESLLDGAIAGSHRSAANKARDPHRHPKETLLFFGLKPEMTVVEVWPDTGWFAEVLIPVLRERGKYIAAQYPLEHRQTSRGNREARAAFEAKLKADPAIYDRVAFTEVSAPQVVNMAPPGSVDMVLTFRSVHVWAVRGNNDAMFKAMFDVLKAGGILGVTDHRAKEGTPARQQARSGYMAESYVIEAAEKAGFKLAGRSEIAANPRDTKDYSEGVWALPPSLSGSENDRAKYIAIGESDRMVLKFVKP